MTISKNFEKLFYIINAILIFSFIILWVTADLLFSEDMFFSSILDTILLIIASGIAGLLCLYLASIYNLSTSTGKIWFFIGLGMFGWLVGDLLFTYYEIFTEEAPFPSIADFFYLIAYIPLSLGLIIQMRLLKVPLSTSEKIVILLIYLAVCVFIVLMVIIFPIQNLYEGGVIPQEDLLGITIAALYPIFDLILLICVMIVFVKLRHGQINKAWLLLLIGILFIIIADIVFTWKENVSGVILTWEYYDLLFLIGYIFIYISAFSIISIMSRTFQKNEN